MEDKLVTLAIHTFEQAQILKTLLESEGIETCIHNVNLVQPMVSAGVRVRIREKDLTKALSIIEKVNFMSDEDTNPSQKKNKILIPVDFSDYSMKACDIAFRLADSLNDAEVRLLHTYFTPIYNSIPVFDTVSNYSTRDEETLVRIAKQAAADMENLCNFLNKKIKSGELPNVKFDTELKEGISVEEIIRFCKDYEPSLVIMGTRGKDRKEQDLIGSVAAEVIDRSVSPVFVIPENIEIDDFSNVKNLAYTTNFAQKDLVAFEKLMELLKPFRFKVHFIHIEQDTSDVWNEVKLAGIKEYFKKHYPDLETDYVLWQGKDILASLDGFIAEKNIDVISLTTYRRNLFARIFNPSIARKMVFHARTPMLVLHA